ncbi:MAG: tRNA pseudouridine(54/55) synthase Pus10 [Pyrodictiaceae archaeon]
MIEEQDNSRITIIYNTNYKDKANIVAKTTAEIISKAIEILLSQPLCDRCLGRLFGLLGRGFSNAERGEAIKKLIVLSLHEMIRKGDEEAKELFKLIAPRLTPYGDRLYEELFGSPPIKEECSICGGKLEKFFEETAERLLEEIEKRGIRANSFLLGVRLSRDVTSHEDDIRIKFGLEYMESISSEIKREISKIIQKKSRLRPDFENPDIVAEIEYPSGIIELRVQPVLLEGTYWKLARRVSQTLWLTRKKQRKYPYSVEEALYKIAEQIKGATIVLHGSGREDVDVRMLGTGRPFILEVKEPKNRVEYVKLIGKSFIIPGFVKAYITAAANRKRVAELKEEAKKHRKTYYAIVVSERELDENDLKALEEFFRDRSIRQRTPRRVRHRRPDVVRTKRVYQVKTRMLTPRVFAALIEAEGGLYIKELISGDEGDTRPSFAEKLNTRLYCASLDVVAVESPGRQYDLE